MSKTWPGQDVKGRSSELLKTNLAEGPQIVTKRGAETTGPAESPASLTGWSRLAVALIATAAAMISAPVAASDMYLRVGIGVDRPAGTVFMDRDCSSVSPAALYGCGRGGDGAPYRSRGGFGTAPVLESALGYAPASAFRMELLVEQRPRLAFRGHANFLDPGRRQSVGANLSALSGMFAGYVDLPELGLPKAGRLGPFVGGGAGIVRTRIGKTRMTFPRTATVVPGAGRTDLAWLLTAGVAVTLDEHMTLDLAWRYSDLGEVRTGRGAGRVIWLDGSRGPLLLDLAETRAALRAHGLRLSLRYAF